MAPDAAALAVTEESTRQNVHFDTFQSWLAIFGNAEYVMYKREAVAPYLSYEDWASSEHPLGPYLYHLTLNAWNDDTSSDEDVKEHANLTTPASPTRQRPKPDTTNGDGVTSSIDTPMPVAELDAEEFEASTKKRRKQKKKKKKFLSEAVILSEDNDDSPSLHADNNADEAEAPVKKRKQKRTVLTESTLLPEEIEEPAPVADTDHPTSATATPDGPDTSSAPRRGLRIRNPAQQRPYFHHAKLFGEIGEDELKAKNSKLSPPTKSKLAQVLYPHSDQELSDNGPDEVVEDVLEPPPSGKKKFKGPGRAWKKDESDEDVEYNQGLAKKPKKRGRPRKQRASQSMVPNEPHVQDEERDDSEITVAKPSPKEARRPRMQRKSHLSEEFVRDDSSSDGAQAEAQSEEHMEHGSDVITLTYPIPEERPKRRPRKSYLSLEFIGSDTESEEEQVEKANDPEPEPQPEPEPVRATQTSQGKERTKRKPRRPHLSEEFVQDESTDSDKAESIVASPAKNAPILSSESTSEQQPSSKTFTPRSKSKSKEQTSSRAQSPTLENGSVANSPARKGRKRKTGSLASVGSVHSSL